MEQKEEETKQGEHKSDGRGVAMGLILCGVSLVLFSRVIPMPSWMMWTFALFGLAVELLGCLGICIEQFK